MNLLKAIIAVPFFTVCILANGQKLKKLPESKVSSQEVEKHIRFLASDALMGRKAGSEGNNAAAAYIESEFRALGLQAPSGDSYYQMIPIEKTTQDPDSKLSTENLSLEINQDYLLRAGKDLDLQKISTVRLPYAWEDATYSDFKDVDVKGKIIIAQVGTPANMGFLEMMAKSAEKAKLAKKYGAVGLIEFYASAISWNVIKRYFGDDRLSVKEEGTTDLPVLFMAKSTVDKIGDAAVSFNSKGINSALLPSNNVLGYLKGTDPTLSNEFIVITAHYDHIGHRAPNGPNDDYIFNGARDNAMGVASLLTAAKCIAAKPLKRSVLFIAYTAEELGLIGSHYYAEHPLIPLEKCVFNLNTDGAGYNDKTKITGIGIARTGVMDEVKKAATSFGLTLLDDPVPELGLFDRSDNVSLAVKGIPAPTLSAGFTAFDEELNKFYHKEADNAESLDFDYCKQYCQVLSLVARYIGNKTQAPAWPAGDKYEAAYKTLYQK